MTPIYSKILPNVFFKLSGGSRDHELIVIFFLQNTKVLVSLERLVDSI